MVLHIHKKGLKVGCPSELHKDLHSPPARVRLSLTCICFLTPEVTVLVSWLSYAMAPLDWRHFHYALNFVPWYHCRGAVIFLPYGATVVAL